MKLTHGVLTAYDATRVGVHEEPTLVGVLIGGETSEYFHLLRSQGISPTERKSRVGFKEDIILAFTGQLRRRKQTSIHVHFLKDRLRRLMLVRSGPPNIVSKTAALANEQTRMAMHDTLYEQVHREKGLSIDEDDLRQYSLVSKNISPAFRQAIRTVQLSYERYHHLWIIDFCQEESLAGLERLSTGY